MKQDEELIRKQASMPIKTEAKLWYTLQKNIQWKALYMESIQHQ